ncbi:DUF3060 domain-containing protein [Mycobacterium servetii]|uniref:DUF3060 domain-containing protein n=1 Tax=Mycobacterium servetii TaxID=3237418 RepID=A0ABV4CA67_9MYCO
MTNAITVTGHCATPNVSGNENRVTVDSADAVSTPGTGDRVTYHRGAPEVVDAGTANTVPQG